jgi:biotin operon repressor
MEIQELEAMVGIMKALSDVNRLRIVGLLARRPRAVEELAAATKLSAPTVSHHLSRLRAVGLVSSEREQYYTIYRLEQEPLLRLGQQLGGRTADIAPARGAEPEDAYDRGVLENFLVGGRLVSIPRQRKKREAVLRHLVKQFASGREYSEPEVNAVLGAFHEDVATLRRELVGYGMLDRNQGQYRRAENDG